MTVLVSVVRQAIAEGTLNDARPLLREHRRHERVARGLRRRRGASRRRAPAARPRVDGAARPAARARRARCFALETDFDGCMAVVKELARRGLVYLANSMNPLRIEGQKTVADRDRAAVRLGVARLDHPAERQPRQRRRALRRLPDDAGARARRAHAAPLRRAGRARQPDVPRVRRRQGRRRAHRRRGDARQRHPDRQPGERAARDGRAHGDERRRRAGDRGRARRRLRPRRPHGPLHVPAHGRRARVPLQAARARASSSRSSASSSSRRRTG